MTSDPYSVLGVQKSASEAEIKSAFRKLAKKWHPDTAGSDAKAKERAQAQFSKVNQAYEIIGDAKKRKQFDAGQIDADGNERATFDNFGFGGQRGHARQGRRGPDPFSAGGGFGGMGGGSAEDIIREMFGGMGGDPRGQQARQKPQQPPESKAKLTVDLSEVLRGEKVDVLLDGGRKLAISIPPGTRDGDKIRLRGQGDPGYGSRRGDLLLEISIRTERGWTLRGPDVLGDFSVPLAIAVNGGKVPVKTPKGNIALTVPPWSDGGKTFRLKGKGLPNKTGDAGDLIMTMRIVLPEDKPEALATLMQRLG
jgi:DnaJ-class molecular chaperone